jgi:nucleotide-binding universal stress UspA family protein
MFQSILCAVDPSEAGLHAASEILKLGGTGIRTTVLSVMPNVTRTLPESSSHEEEVRRPYKEILGEVERKAAEHGVPVQTVQDSGRAWEVIVAKAKEVEADLVVLGARQGEHLKRRVLGSTASRVIGHCPCDVLVVPRETTLHLERVLVATDGSRPAGAALLRAIGLAKSQGGELRVVSVMKPGAVAGNELPRPHASGLAGMPNPDAAMGGKVWEQVTEQARQRTAKIVEEAVDKARAEGVRADQAMGEGEPYVFISDEAKKHESGCIVVGSHGRTGLKRLLMGSVTERVVELAPCPVYVVPAHE